MTEYNYKFTQDWSHVLSKTSALISSNKLNEAEVILLETLKEDPNSASLLNAYAVLLQMQERLLESVETFKKAADISPRDYSIWFNLGITYAKLGNFIASLEAFDKSLALDEMNLPALHAKSQIYTGLKDYKSALNMVDKALNFAPKNLNFLKSKAIILRNLGYYPQMIETLELISSLDPSDEEIKITLMEIKNIKNNSKLGE